MKNSRFLDAAVVGLAGLVWCGCFSTVQAANRTWNGDTDPNWNTAANWDEGALGSNNTPVFGTAGTSGTALRNDTAAGTSVAGIRFEDAADAFTITGKSITLSGDITVGTDITTETLDLPIVLNNNRTLRVNSGVLTLGGAVSESGTNRQLIKQGLGTVVLAGAGAYTGLTRVVGGATIVDAGAGGSLATSELRFGLSNNYEGGGAFIYDNTTSTGATALTLPSVQLERALPNDNVIQVTRSAAQDVSLTIATLQTHNIENGHNINFVANDAAGGGANGTNYEIVLGNQTAYRITVQNAYFNGGDFAVYDDGPDNDYATPLDGFVRGIDYGVDADSATSAGGASFAGTTNQQITGSITAQTAVTLGDTSGQKQGTLKIVGASDLTLQAGAQLNIRGRGNSGSYGMLKTGGGASTISGGAGATLRVSTNAQSSYRVDGPMDVLEIAVPLIFINKDRFMKSGEGTLILSNDISFTDGRNPLWINGGVVEIGGDAMLSKVSATILSAGATFRYNSTSTTSTHAGQIQGLGHVEVSSGKLTLTDGNSSYAGDTWIGGGTLSIVDADLADTADVYMSNDGTLDLNFVGTDTIDSLFFDGAPQGVGTWGSIGNGLSTFESEFFTGTGLLAVSTLGQSDFNPDLFPDNFIDDKDLNVLLSNFGSPYSQGNLDVLLTQFGSAVGPAAVAEPSGFALLALGSVGLGFMNRYRNKQASLNR